jgi:hypothetical protein
MVLERISFEVSLVVALALSNRALHGGELLAGACGGVGQRVAR